MAEPATRAPLRESELKAALQAEKAIVEKELRRLMRLRKGVPDRLLQAMRHSLLGGGKRLRPIIALWVWDAVAAGKGGLPRGCRPRAAVLLAGAGLEMIHTYSLIHDDLPAMDDDVLRRGRPTCHVAFDEATAILAGDALQALGFQQLAEAGGQDAGTLVQLVARSVGPAGMVGGQQEDLDAEGQAPTSKTIQSIHLKKTAALLVAAFGTGGLLAGLDGTKLDSLCRAGQELGMAFQGADDLLDVTASTEQLGKSAGKDVAAGKATWVQLEGLEAARRRTRRHGLRGTRLLEESLPACRQRDRLVALGDFLWNRER
jgi:geranylgeranyl pyrophosphate synthase